jgi:hypothetical protein
VLDVIARAREGLTEEDINVRRIFLKKFVDKVEIGNAKGKLYHSFPLETVIPTGMWLVPPRGLFYKSAVKGGTPSARAWISTRSSVAAAYVTS